LPILANASAEAKLKRSEEKLRQPFLIRKGAVNLAGENLVFDFEIPGVGPFSFLMDKAGGRLLLSPA
jgi:hypothetical protein